MQLNNRNNEQGAESYAAKSNRWKRNRRRREFVFSPRESTVGAGERCAGNVCAEFWNEMENELQVLSIIQIFGLRR